MRIAQVAPLTESVPPRTYGGTERVVSYLTETLVELGHDVTLYAAGDTLTKARLVACCRKSLRRDPGAGDPILIHRQMMQRILAEAESYDIIHFHIGWFEFPVFTGHSTACLTTLHGRLDVPKFNTRLRAYPDFPFVSISNAQRQPLPDVNWLGTVYHGLPDMPPPAAHGSGGYLAFLGRIAPEKRPDLAIEIAHRAQMPLKIAAKVDRVDQAYFDTVIRPLLALPGIEFIGEVGEAEKMALLAEASALLFPIDWPEPFGLVMIEAMACGTPVVAFRRGSVPEVIDDGVTGWIVRDADEAVAALAGLERIDRQRIRSVFDERFSARRMGKDYLKLYRALLEERRVTATRERRVASSSGVAALAVAQGSAD